MESTPSRFDRYEVLAPLGAGGMGEVVKARALGPHGFEKIVAIKRIRAEWADQEAMAERFIREARIAARLQHSNIVQVFDFGRHGDELFIVMEFVDGQSLDAILAALSAGGRRPTIAQALQIALDLSRALDSAHNLTDEDNRPVGVVHRDVSPANVLLSREGVVKLTDFGIASWSTPDQRTSLVAGKPLYMAPEQVRGDMLDGRADLFAVGIVLYELLTGERPWKGMVDSSPNASLADMSYRPPSVFVTGIPSQLDALLAKLLAPAREDRLSSARELTKEIVSLSYACQIVLDSSELAALVEVPSREAAHAPTLPQYAGVGGLRTLVATGVSPDGVTLLKTEDDPVEVAPSPKGLPAWVWAALALLVIGAGVAAALSVLGREPAPIRAEASIAREPIAQSSETAPTEPAASVATEDDEPEEPVVELAVADGGFIAAPAASDVQESPPARVRRPRPPGSEPPRDADERPAPAASGTGELDVFSRPWAELWIDGARHAQNAPARGISLPAGRHRLRLVNPHLGLSAERTVDVPAGGRAQVRVFLDQEASAPQ